MRLGDKISERVMNAPTLQTGLEFWLMAFNELDSERHHGNGPMRIPRSSIIQYAKDYELDDDDTEFLKFIIMKMDTAIINRMIEKQKAQDNKRNAKQSFKPSRTR